MNFLDWKYAMNKYATKHGFELASDFNAENPFLGSGARDSLVIIKQHAGIRPHDGTLNLAVMNALRPYLPTPPPPQTPTKSDLLVKEGWWWINHSQQCDYAEERPIPYREWKAREHVVTHCSGSYSCMVYTVGLHDPNGEGFSGIGNTNTLLQHMPHVTRQYARPGCCIVFGYPGISEHVSMLLEPGANSDPLIFNHGHAGPPDEPSAMHLSVLLDYFGSLPHTYCSPFN